MEYTIQVHLQNGDYLHFEITHLFTHSTNISLEHQINKYKALFLVIYHKKVQTLIDLTGVKNSVMLIFNRDKEYIGFNVCHSDLDSSFVIASRAKYALIIPEENFLSIHYPISHLETIFDVNIEMA